MTAIILRRRKLGRTSCREIAREAGMKVVRNWCSRDWRGCGDLMDPLLVFRWGCTSSLVGLGHGIRTVNTAKSIHWCSDKRQGRLDMQAAGVPVPVTHSLEDAHQEINNATFDYLRDRWVARPVSHSQGRHLFCGSASECVEWLESNHGDGYIAELIDKVAEFRVFVCQNRAVWVAQKTPGNPDDVAWNVARGGRFDNVRWSDWNTKVLDAALKAAKISGTDFCGVDVMVDAEGRPYVLEVNSAPSQTSPYRQGCVAKAFSHIVQNGTAHFPDVVWTESKTWKSYIHPAVRGQVDD